jgi:predicted ATP-dependent endonuclease of OLD family
MQTDINLPKTRNLYLPPPISSQQLSTEIQAKSSIVIVGANGSGKSRFGAWIDLESPQKSLVHRVGAQKSLSIPEYCSTSSIDAAENYLLYGYYQHNLAPEQLENYKIGHRWQSKPITLLQSDYDKLLTYLFTEEFEKSTKYRQQVRATEQPEVAPETRLDIIKRIWELVLPHRELIIGAGKIEARPKSGGASYHAAEMSDGERVIFYLIGQCLAARENGILVIDEPELHIHRALQSRLWDAVESERPDCLFVYLTHDLDFAVTRVSATKIWLKSYENNRWNWHLVPENEEIPERLLLEILGSRKPILFVEGERNSLEYFLFSHLFKKFTVTPCGGHEQVIHSTSSFLKLKSLHALECKGIIDRDFRTDEQVEYLKTTRDILSQFFRD